MRLLSASIALLCLAGAIAITESSWSESTTPELGANEPSSEPADGGKRKTYLIAKMNEVRANCKTPLAPITNLVVKSITKQIVEGTSYTADVTVDGIDKVVTFVKLLDDEQKPHHFTKGKGKGNIKDLFELRSIHPHPCGEDTAVLSDETEEALEAKYSTGLKMPEYIDYDDTPVSPEQLAQLPTNFDWRDEAEKRFGDRPKAATVINQGSCGSCWAFGAAAAAGYRTIIASKGQYNVVPSTQVGMTCSHVPRGKDPCGGGWFNDLYDTLNEEEIPANWAVPYLAKAGQCKVESDSISIKGGTSRAIRGVDAMMNELYTNGPFGMAIDAGPSCFKRYKSGVADCPASGLSHAVVAVGWGTENGKPYWLVQNSWGAGWGDAGFIKVARGTNSLNMEKHGAQPNYISPEKMACRTSPPCKNGGAFKKDCSCHCLSGYSGAQCDSCQKSCSGAQFTGQAGISGGKCQCKCAAGHVSPTNLLGYSDCALQIKVGDSTDTVVKVGAGATVSIDFKVVGDAPTTTNQKVKKGDMFVGVPAGETPWNAKDGWSTDIKADVCGPKSWPASPCGTSEPSLKFTKDGVYSIFFVKYLGKSEFGTDKGYGSDFMELPQRICVGSADCDADIPPPPPPGPPPSPPPAPHGPPPPAPAPSGCTDSSSSQCPSFARRFDCNRQYKINGRVTYLKDFCSKSCGKCGGSGGGGSGGNSGCARDMGQICRKYGNHYCSGGATINKIPYKTYCCATCHGQLLEIGDDAWNEVTVELNEE